MGNCPPQTDASARHKSAIVHRFTSPQSPFQLVKNSAQAEASSGSSPFERQNNIIITNEVLYFPASFWFRRILRNKIVNNGVKTTYRIHCKAFCANWQFSPTRTYTWNYTRSYTISLLPTPFPSSSNANMHSALIFRAEISRIRCSWCSCGCSFGVGSQS